jgi:putative lipoic acid-binding regulatory protein
VTDVPPPSEPPVSGGLEFPADHPLKLIGRNTPEFREQVRAIIARLPPKELVEDSEKVSRDGNYLSLTCHVHVTTRGELEALYRELHATGLVIYAL